MMDLTFYKLDNTYYVQEVSDNCYGKLAILGFGKYAYKTHKLLIESEEYEVDALYLTNEIRIELSKLIELERQIALENIFEKLDEKPSLKEIRDNFIYIKELTLLYKNINNKEYTMFSYD